MQHMSLVLPVAGGKGSLLAGKIPKANPWGSVLPRLSQTSSSAYSLKELLKGRMGQPDQV